MRRKGTRATSAPVSQHPPHRRHPTSGLFCPQSYSGGQALGCSRSFPCHSVRVVGLQRAREDLPQDRGTGWWPVPHGHPPLQLTHRAGQPATMPQKGGPIRSRLGKRQWRIAETELAERSAPEIHSPV